MKKIKLRRVCIVLLIVIVAFVLANIWASSNWLTINNYEFDTDKVSDEIKMVVLSDMHNHVFGKENQKLVKKVKEQSPDFILLVGDMLNGDEKNTEIVCGLTTYLSEIAPVYFALGNHEMQYLQEQDENLVQQLEAAGAEVLEEDYVDLEINDTSLRLGGFYEYAFGYNPENGENEGEWISEERGEFLREFENTEKLKVMMSHRPDSFIFGDASTYWNVDLVVSGHNHGGQVVVPFLGGAFGGDQGWFPKYIHGMYQKNNIKLFITSGLGSNKQKIPRFNNRPEIAVMTIKGK